MGKSNHKEQYFISTVIVVATAALCFPFTDWIGYRSVALILLLVVSILGVRYQLYPVLLAATMSAFIWNFFFIPPIFTFAISSKEDVLLLIMYFVAASVNGIFNYKLRQFEQVKHQKEERETAIKLYNTLFDSLSHELRTPIATILGATDALLEHKPKLSEQDKHELTHEISLAALRLNYQVENLLNVSRLDSGFIKPNFEWCDVSELIYGVLSKLQKTLEHHKISIEIPDNLPLVKLDYGLTEQIILNLIKNAVIHTSDNTHINITAKVVTDKSGHFEGDDNIVDAVSEVLVLRILDNGKGIPIESLPYIFNRFYRVENCKTGGTGLGLYIVKGFTEAQNGTVNASNNTENGACFTIEIPVVVLTKNIHYESI